MRDRSPRGLLALVAPYERALARWRAKPLRRDKRGRWLPRKPFPMPKHGKRMYK